MLTCNSAPSGTCALPNPPSELPAPRVDYFEPLRPLANRPSLNRRELKASCSSLYPAGRELQKQKKPVHGRNSPRAVGIVRCWVRRHEDAVERPDLESRVRAAMCGEEEEPEVARRLYTDD